MASQRDLRKREPTRTLPDRVGQLYYSHGLFCSSHPVPVIVFAIAVVLLCCYPLLNLPMPGNVPQQLWGNLSLQERNGSGVQALPQWFVGPPMVYIQQVILKTAVSPWTDDMLLTDAFRAPLAEVFNLLEVIHNFQHENGSKSLSHLCLHVEAVKTRSGKKLQLPEYNCLVLSPANLWQQNPLLFQDDPNLLGTIFTYQNLQKGKISLAEMLFGMNMKDSGIKRYPLRTRQRVLQFAVTIVLKEYDAQFLNGLRQKLTKMFPLHQPSNMLVHPASESNESSSLPETLAPMQDVLYIYYPGEFNIKELVPLASIYFVFFLYVYFSVRKIEMLKSKLGMAFSAVMTVLASLFMSVGLCFFFGLTLTVNGKDFYLYVVAIVGLENVLVLTKSVVSTPTHLDVKIRVAQGLSREGWSITKNLFAEVTILTAGLFTFVPAIQKFCIFAIVSLLCDFFVQMFFFSTVLAIDIHRMELSSETQRIQLNYMPSGSTLNNSFVRHYRSADTSYKSLSRSKSHPRLNGLLTGSSVSSNYPTNIVANPHNSTPMLVKLPKRLRFLHFWARTRIFQRTFMIVMVVWISFIVYSSGVVEELLKVNPDAGISEKMPMEVTSRSVIDDQQDLKALYHSGEKAVNRSRGSDQSVLLDKMDVKPAGSFQDSETGKRTTAPPVVGNLKNEMDELPVDDLVRLRHVGLDPWRRLSHHHWPAILSLYNISFSGQYISILPAIRLSHVVTPEMARSLRNVEENNVQHFQWQALAAALDPLDFSDGESTKIISQKTDLPFVPSSPMEIFLTAVLCIISVVVVSYTLVVFYRCVCTRNYAEWRASWAGEHEESKDAITQVVMEAVPLVLEGHQQEVECLSTDGSIVVSSCLDSQLRVWDSVSGEAFVTIDRRSYFNTMQQAAFQQTTDVKADELSDYESGSPPSRGEIASEESASRSEQALWNLPDLRPAINTNFSNRSPSAGQETSSAELRKKGFNFGAKYEELFREYNSVDKECNRREETGLSKKHLERESDGFPSTVNRVFKLGSNVSNVTRRNTGTFPSSLHDRKRDERKSADFTNDVFGGDNLARSFDKDCGLFYQDESNYYKEKSNVGSLNSKDHNDTLHAYPSSDTPTSQSHEMTNHHEKIVSSPLTHNQLQSDSVRSGISMRREGISSFGVSHNPANRSLCTGSQVPAVWCLDCHENLVVVGCSSGRLEFWEGSTGKFKCLFEDGNGVGITSVKIIGNRVVAAKLNGAVDFFELESYSQGQPIDWGFTSYRRTHVRTNSAGALCDWESWAAQNSVEEDIRCIRLNTMKAHQQPITVLDSEGGRVLTGSQDHTLKVFRLEDQLPLYTLHGHSGPISCLFIDRISPMMSGSGSQDGLLCVWDLLTGACMYSIQAHDGCVVTLTYSASYVISLGTDERLCVWERFQGHLLNTIQVAHTYCSSMVMLTHNLLITSKQGSLVVWDVRTGIPVRIVKLGHSDKCVFVKQILLLRDSVVCDYSNQLRIVRFPLVADKCD